MLKPLRKSKNALVTLVVAVGFVLAMLLEVSGALEVVELKLLDARFLNGYNPYREDSSVVLVAIDQSSLNYFQKQGQSWPWPREFYAVLTRYLTQAGAKVIAFD
ncbi:MAG: CHASE2 domain-containing protein, partial [Candidatus Thermochlorobacter sp.]